MMMQHPSSMMAGRGAAAPRRRVQALAPCASSLRVSSAARAKKVRLRLFGIPS